MIKINNTIYKVHFVNANDNNLRENRGLCNRVTKEIYIDKDLINVDEVIIHELTHAVIEEYLLDTEWNEEKVALFVGKYNRLIFELLNEIKELENE